MLRSLLYRILLRYREDYHFTPHRTISYLVIGDRAHQISSSNKQVTLQFRKNEEKTNLRLFAQHAANRCFKPENTAPRVTPSSTKRKLNDSDDVIPVLRLKSDQHRLMLD